MGDCNILLALALVALIVYLVLRADSSVFALFSGSRDTLSSGGVMVAGDTIRSANGRYTFSVETSRRAVLRDPQGRRRWATPEVGGSGALKLTLSKDGRLELTGGRGSHLWAPGSAENPDTRLKVTDDGKIKLLSRDGQTIWKAP
jgi:outer membrane protein assembly factor BamB